MAGKDLRKPTVLLVILLVGVVGFVIDMMPNPDQAGGEREETKEVTHLVDLGPLYETKPALAQHATRMQTRLNGLFGEGTSALAAADYSLAANSFARVLEIDPDLAEAHVNLGFALLGMRQVNAAKSEFNLARESNPEQANLYYGLAMVHEHEQEIRQAVLAMQTFLHLAEEGHPFVRKATAAIWEWNQRLQGSEREP